MTAALQRECFAGSVRSTVNAPLQRECFAGSVRSTVNAPLQPLVFLVDVQQPLSHTYCNASFFGDL